jgi:PadR family transcriptional regulator, regulatory protein PadR
MGEPLDVLQGTLDLIILRVVSNEPMHGWGIGERIRQISRDALQIQQGSLYPALHRLERRGFIQSKWQDSDNNRRSRYYSLTRAGRKQLERDTQEWARHVEAMQLILQA